MILLCNSCRKYLEVMLHSSIGQTCILFFKRIVVTLLLRFEHLKLHHIHLSSFLYLNQVTFKRVCIKDNESLNCIMPFDFFFIWPKILFSLQISKYYIIALMNIFTHYLPSSMNTNYAVTYILNYYIL